VLASSSLDSHIKLWDLEKASLIGTVDASPGKYFSRDQTQTQYVMRIVETWSLTFSPDGNFIASGSKAGLNLMGNAKRDC